MKLGINLGYWGLGLTAEDQLQLVQEGERLGYDSVWAAEAYGSDAVSVLGWLASATERIRLGSAILQIPARSAAMTAMTAATLDQLSGGRLLLGLGTSGPHVSEGWHGVRFARQLQRTHEYVDVVRMALRRDRVEYHGSTLELPLPDGPGKALKLTIEPAQDAIPLYLAALGPKNIELAGEIADGWLPVMFSPTDIAHLRKPLEQGAARAGRSLDEFAICPSVIVHISDDPAAARDACRPFLALYVGGMGSREKNFYNRLAAEYGFEHEAREIQDLYLAGKRTEAAAALPDALIDKVTLTGPVDAVKERLRQFEDAGVDTVIASTLVEDPTERLRQIRTLAEVAEEAAVV
jgi:F420-dependent oxidoreductase-like protein